MRDIEIIRVNNQSQFKQFVTFPEFLYRNCPNWVPPLMGDEYDTFNPRKNSAYAFCEASCFLAVRDGITVGRVAAIINHKVDDIDQSMRFGWLDFIDDINVLIALMDKVALWGKLRGRKVMKGPWGFTDMDKEGLLVEGYDHLSPFTCLYNYPYYDVRLAQLGFVKDVDWTQRAMSVSPELPPMFQYAGLVEERFGVHVVHPSSTRQLARRYGKAIFHMYNESFAPLENFSPLSDEQIDKYLTTYVPIMDKDFVAIAVDKEDRPVGFLFCVPSLSKAVKRARGRLFPTGIFNIHWALKHNDTLEALLIGVMPEYQGCGVPVLLFKYIHENCIRRGINRIIFNPQLEENHKVQNLFGDYHPEPYMRRRAYRKNI